MASAARSLGWGEGLAQWRRVALLGLPSLRSQQPGQTIPFYSTYLSRKLRKQQQHQAVVVEKDRDRDRDREPKRSIKGLRVGLIGAPNAGKSALTNVLLGRKVTAVSGKVNTTTSQTFGVVTSTRVAGHLQVNESEQELQNEKSNECSPEVTRLMIFDTPGVVDHKHYRNVRQRERVSDAYATAALCDALVFVVDAERQLRKPDPRVERLVVEYRREVEGFGSGDAGGQAAAMPKSVLAMNKVDLVRGSRRGDLLDLARRLNDLGSFDQIFMVSSLKGTGTEDLLAYLRSVSVPHRTEEAVGHGGGGGGTGWLSQCEDEESSHDHSSYAVELVKEQVYRRLNGEIPYVLKIKPVSTKFLRDGSLRIEQDLLVNHMKKKKIVVGRKGQAIGQIGCRARAELEKQLGLKVHLILNVKVRKQD